MSWATGALCWAGWSVAFALACTLGRRMHRLADAEHELRGSAAAIALLADGTPQLRLELDRMSAGLADLAEARGARVAATAADLEAGRLAQVLGNVAANAAEHGVGPVAVRARRVGSVVWLEVANGDGAGVRRRGSGGERVRLRFRPRLLGRRRPGRGRGLRIARRAARRLGGRLMVERDGGVTRAVVELPAEEVDGTGRRAA